MMKYLIASAGLAALTACSQQDDVYRSYFSEAGALVDGGEFGNANMNNQQVMTNERAFAISLAKRFAAEVPSTINFAFNSSQLDEAARETLREQANWIRQFPEVRFKVFGHTDAVGSNGYNNTLGRRRANAVVAFLGTQGISRKRLQAVVSFGETQPLIVSEGRERRNRRTVTEVSGFVKSSPQIMDGKYAQVVYREYVESAVPPSTLILVDNVETLQGSQ
jgi:outer membrane protein OmpA-like peptidoglycan-associated protein